MKFELPYFAQALAFHCLNVSKHAPVKDQIQKSAIIEILIKNDFNIEIIES